MSEELCPMCGSSQFAVLRDMTSRRKCGCGHMWDCPAPTNPKEQRMTVERAIEITRLCGESKEPLQDSIAIQIVLNELERLRTALEFYASQWRSDVYCGPTELLVMDGGDIARRALGQGSEGT